MYVIPKQSGNPKKVVRSRIPLRSKKHSVPECDWRLDPKYLENYVFIISTYWRQFNFWTRDSPSSMCNSPKYMCGLLRQRRGSGFCMLAPIWDLTRLPIVLLDHMSAIIYSGDSYCFFLRSIHFAVVQRGGLMEFTGISLEAGCSQILKREDLSYCGLLTYL